MERTEKSKKKNVAAEGESYAEDKRMAHRYALALDTEVHFYEPVVKGMFRCRTSNIGLSGVFLPSDKMPITSKTDIKLVFRVRPQSKSNKYSISAKVVRNAADGAALVFCPTDEKQIQDLHHFLLKAKTANQQ